jgi:hypothetical protein
MELVDKLRIVARRGKQKWHKHDKVLAQLDPLQVRYINEFYEEDGPPLKDLMGEQELAEYDLWCLGQLLEWLKEQRPDVAEVVVESASA